jgi:rubrerythrin
MLNVKELFKFAIILEENSCAFFRQAVKITQDEDAKVIFETLGDEELKHKKLFEAMHNQSHDLPLNEAEGDVSLLLHSTLSNIIPLPEQFQAELEAIREVRGALKFGLQREADAML